VFKRVILVLFIVKPVDGLSLVDTVKPA